MPKDEMPHQSAADAISELLKASADLLSHYTAPGAGPSDSAGPERNPADIMSCWQAQWRKLFWSACTIYGFGPKDSAQAGQEDVYRTYQAFQDVSLRFIDMLAGPVKDKFYEFAQERKSGVNGDAQGQPPADLYKAWMQDLEQRYSALFSTPEFAASLQRVIHTAMEAAQLRKGWVADILQSASMPSKEDYDALLREFHALKRTVRQLCRQLEA